MSNPIATDAVLELLQQLIRIPSVNPSLASDGKAGEAGGTGEAAVADYARGWLAERGIDAWLEDVAPGRPNVVARASSER